MTPKAHSINLVGISADFLASPGFNETAVRIEIPGVRAFNGELFSMLADAESLQEAERAFILYMNALYAIDAEQASSNISSPFRSSYLKLLHGWGFDSNGPDLTRHRCLSLHYPRTGSTPTRRTMSLALSRRWRSAPPSMHTRVKAHGWYGSHA